MLIHRTLLDSVVDSCLHLFNIQNIFKEYIQCKIRVVHGVKYSLLVIQIVAMDTNAIEQRRIKVCQVVAPQVQVSTDSDPLELLWELH